MPIPQSGTGLQYIDYQAPPLVSSSFLPDIRAKVRQTDSMHLDPDLEASWLLRRPVGWKPCFGQHGAALKHLQNEGVSVGDLFLFFGWFKALDQAPDGRWFFRREAPDIHLIYGWLEVGAILDLRQQEGPDWAHAHPHIQSRDQFVRGGNSLFIAREQSTWLAGKPGAGCFQYHDSLVLTDCSHAQVRRSQWKLPKGFFTPEGACKLSYHRHKSGLQSAKNEGFRQLQAAYRGQEFVLQDLESVRPWAQELFRLGSRFAEE